MTVPLTIGTAPFIARMIENAFKEVDKSVIEAAKSFGTNKFQIIFRVLLPEAYPSIISSITLALIIIIGFSGNGWNRWWWWIRCDSDELWVLPF